MQGFREFVTHENDDVKKTISQLPSHHQALVKGYEFLFEPHNTLKGDDGHVGVITNKPRKIIRVAAPWRWSREFTVLHEIAHLVYEAYIRGTELEKEWEKVALAEPNRKKDESAEELFCHSYAAKFCKFPPSVHFHPKWINFIKKVCAIEKPVRTIA